MKVGDWVRVLPAKAVRRDLHGKEGMIVTVVGESIMMYVTVIEGRQFIFKQDEIELGD